MSKKSSTALESALAWMEKHAAENLDLGSLRKLTTEIAKNNEELKELAVKLGLALDRRETSLKRLKDELKNAKAARKAKRKAPAKSAPAAAVKAGATPATPKAPAKSAPRKVAAKKPSTPQS